MKYILMLLSIVFSSCAQHSREEKAIIKYMEANANDPASYEPVSFRFIGPATFENTGLSKGDSTRLGDLYEHAFRAKNGFGALMLTTKVFAIMGGSANPLPDSLAERAQANYRP